MAPGVVTSTPAAYRGVAGMVRGVERLARWQVDASGFEHVPAAGGAVLTWNHTSHVDVLVTLELLLRRTGRWARLLAVRDVWEGPLLGPLARLARCVPVDRTTDAGRREAYALAVDALRAGDLVAVAPEGTISPSGQLLPFRTGAARMARAAGVPVLPTASWGTHRFVTTGHGPSLRHAWRLPVAVRVGAPLHVGPDDAPADATEVLRERTRALLDDARRALATP